MERVYKPEDFMRKSVFEARLDEFSFDIKRYSRASKMVLRAFKVKYWSQISELQLGKAFRMMQELMYMTNEKAPFAVELQVG